MTATVGFAISSNFDWFFKLGLLIGYFLMGIFFQSNMVAEGILLLKYSPPKDREVNIGKFRAAQGLGSVLCPLIVASLLAFADYWAPFVFVACNLALVIPYITRTLNKCAEDYNNEDQLDQIMNEDDHEDA